MDLPITLRYTNTLPVYLAATDAYRRSLPATKIRRIAIWVLIPLAVIDLGILFALHARLPSSVLILLAVVVAALCSSPLITRYYHRNVFNKLPRKNMEITYTISAEAIAIATELSEARLLWEGIYQIIETPEHFLFFPQANIYHFIPKSSFPDDATVQAFAELARSRVAKYRVIK